MSGNSLSCDSAWHPCFFYRTLAEQKAVVLPFVLEGLRNGEQCVHVTDAEAVDDWYIEFQAFGIDVATELQRRRLIVCAGEHWLGAGEFSSIVNARRTWEMIEAAQEEFSGIRFVVDAGWMLDPSVSAGALCHWEATLNPLIADEADVRVLCQYNLNHHSAGSIYSALRTHPIAMLGGKAYLNPYFEAPMILENEPHLNYLEAEPGMVEGMLLHLSENQPLSL